MPDQFSHLLEKFLRDELSEPELGQFLEAAEEPANWEAWGHVIEEKLRSGVYTGLYGRGDMREMFRQTMEKAEAGVAVGEVRGADIAGPGKLRRMSYWVKAIAACSAAAVLLWMLVGSGYFFERAGHATGAKDQGRVGEAVTGEVVVLQTPKGRSTLIELSDGTKVWLNAASTLRYPANFHGDKREVELSGEAYFEVTANARMPFCVKAGHTDIRVLGTHFNVTAYAEDRTVRTTLLEGKVEVRSGGQTRMLRPGQQAVARNEQGEGRVNVQAGDVVVQEVHTERAVAWTSGSFLFGDSDLRSILQEISRWYDVEVVYEGNIDYHETYGGRISRQLKLAEVLSLLEEGGLGHFTIKGKKIIVTP